MLFCTHAYTELLYKKVAQVIVHLVCPVQWMTLHNIYKAFLKMWLVAIDRNC